MGAIFKIYKNRFLKIVGVDGEETDLCKITMNESYLVFGQSGIAVLSNQSERRFVVVDLLNKIAI